MAANSRAAWRLYWLRFLVAIALFVFGVIVYCLSGFELRQRAAKRACRGGDIAACVQVANYYEARSHGLIGFLMSNSDTALRYYQLACAGRSAPACERMVYVLKNGEQAGNLSVPLTDIVDAMIASCIEQVPGACDHLGDLFEQGDWVAVRAGNSFKRGCDANKPEACYRLAVWHAHNLGGLDKTLEVILPLYEKGCAAHIAASCEGAERWRAERDRRAAQSPSPAPVRPLLPSGDGRD